MTEKLTRTIMPGPRTTGLVLAAWIVSTMALTPCAVGQAPQGGGYQPPAFGQQPALQMPTLPHPQAISPNGEVVEDVIARVNDQIITRSEYERSEQQLIEDANRAHAPQAEVEDRLHNLLRDMIDQQLLLSKGKELGITGDAETMRQLDEIRKQNHMTSMEELEKAAQSQGVSFEDFKQRIRDQIISRQVVQEEVGRRINMTHTQEQAYYAAHQKDFEVPEQVHLSEILLPTPENATDAQIAAVQAKADDLEAKLKGGASFADLAKANSGGPTAQAGGDLGDFKRGALGTVLEDATFSLPEGGVTAPIRTRQGFVILKVDSHQKAGVPPLEKVEPQVQEALYMDALQPALRAYLTKARQDAYMEVESGFVDTGNIKKAGAKPEVAFTAYKAPAIKKRTLKKQRLEQQKAAQAQAVLASAREKVAEKQAVKAAAQASKSGGGKPEKPRRVRKEKIRYGQAPENALPTAPTTAAVESAGGPIQGQAPGVAMAPTQSVTTISTGTGLEASNEGGDALAQADEAPHKKTRYTSRETEAQEQKAEKSVTKAEVKASVRPVAATQQETQAEKVQAAPLGLNGDTVAKKKHKRQKGDAKERLQEKPKEAEPAPPEPTVNPALGKTPALSSNGQTPAASKGSAQPSADATTLPSTTTGAPGSNPTGQPIPSTTSAAPNQPTSTTKQEH
jgi:peptidyl-prolyl cis-trans isomerase SurA